MKRKGGVEILKKNKKIKNMSKMNQNHRAWQGGVGEGGKEK